MDVSNRDKNLAQDAAKDPAEDLAKDLEGHELIQTLVTLTGLPESFARQELDQILEMSGHSTPTAQTHLTLDELRAALLAYMEQLQPVECDSAADPIPLHRADDDRR